MGTTCTAAALGLDLAEIDERLAAGLNLPTRCYTDPAIHDFEMAAIFDVMWQYAAPRAHLARPGDVVTADIGRTPVILTRDRDGELHGFVNACRHRGFRLVDGDTTCSKIQCAYHSWIYDLDGVLARAPKAEQDLRIVPGEIALHPVSVSEWGHGVWVNPDPAAMPFLDAHPGLDAAAERLGIDHDLDRFVPYTRSVTTQAANWKLWYDNGTECYHCPTVHRESFGAAYDTVNGFAEQFCGETFSGSHFDPAPTSDGAVVGGGYRSFQSFPGTQYIQQDGLMIMARAIPTAPGEMTFVADYLAERGTPDEQVDEWVKLWDLTYAEDAEVVEQTQRNFGSGRVTELRYVDGMEDVSRFFHGLVRDAYRHALAG